MLAAPGADLVAADAAGFESKDDEAYLASDVFVPGLLRIGGFAGCAVLAAPHPLLVHRTSPGFTGGEIRSIYTAAAAGDALKITADAIPDAEVAEWIGGGGSSSKVEGGTSARL